jgi:hypothetical protein
MGAVRRAPSAGDDGVKYVLVGESGSHTDWSETLEEIERTAHWYETL